MGMLWQQVGEEGEVDEQEEGRGGEDEVQTANDSLNLLVCHQLQDLHHEFAQALLANIRTKLDLIAVGS